MIEITAVFSAIRVSIPPTTRITADIDFLVASAQIILAAAEDISWRCATTTMHAGCCEVESNRYPRDCCCCFHSR